MNHATAGPAVAMRLGMRGSTPNDSSDAIAIPPSMTSERQQPVALRTAAEPRRHQVTAGGDPGQHGGEHQGVAVDGRAHEQRDDTEPDDFEGERNEPRHCEDDEQHDLPRVQGAWPPARPPGHRRDRRRCRVPAAAAPRNGGDRHESVDGRGNQERTLDPGARDEDQPREQTAGDRSGGVRGIEHADPPAQPLRLAQRRLHDERQRRAHQRRGDDEDGEGHRQPHDRQRHRRAVQRRVHGGVRALQHVERERRGERGQANQRFRDAQPDQRPPHAIRGSAAKHAADGEARHEHGPHRARGVYGHAEDQPKKPKPEDLIDQRARAREEKQDSENQEAARELDGRLAIGAALAEEYMAFT